MPPCTYRIFLTPLGSCRNDLYQSWVDKINKTEHGFNSFSNGYKSFGFQVLPGGAISYKEWAPNAVTASLIGDFSAFASSCGMGPGSGELTFASRSARRMGQALARDEEERVWRV